MSLQLLRLSLEGITAGDYLTWVRDPEPPALGWGLRSVTVRADPLGDSIEAELSWNSQAPAPQTAALAAGFPLTPEVAAVRASEPIPSNTNAPRQPGARSHPNGRPKRRASLA
jgi:hypothetical protein